MFLGAIDFNTINTFKLSRAHTKPISFCAQVQTDSFKKRAKVESLEFVPNLSDSAKQKLLNSVVEIANNPDTPVLGYGATGVVYQVKNVEGLNPNGAVIKISYTQDKNPITGERQKVGFSYDEEISALKKAVSLGDNSQQYLASAKLTDGRNVLITTFVDGVQPDAIKNPINAKALRTVIETLTKLDTAGILHRDLKKENLVVDSEDRIKLIDFGEAVEFDFLDTKANDAHNFPSFEVPTNFQSFEDTFISPYYDDLSKINKGMAEVFFSNYLKQKAIGFYGFRATQLQRYLDKNKENLSDEQVETLKTMIDFQDVNYSVLSKEYKNPDIVNIELMKNQVMYLSELAYKNEVLLCNPLANVSLKANALISAKKLEAMVLEQINRPNKPEVRKYLDYQLQNAHYRQQKIAGWLNGLVGWFTTCLTTDINTSDENKKKLIDECVYGVNLEDFEIPNIVDEVN